eukprot:TRINITY_DN8516_c0_g1_i3.p1 TRINITY_DN8516_c0_g1~~TRINITY_DN8516_c0_g1_i3.p1  ORF type:complete len:109 (+),score=18.88 TRINITY_DN8516_c0_g1_i3:68-394(+)
MSEGMTATAAAANMTIFDKPRFNSAAFPATNFLSLGNMVFSVKLLYTKFRMLPKCLGQQTLNPIMKQNMTGKKAPHHLMIIKATSSAANVPQAGTTVAVLLQSQWHSA